MNQLVTDQWLNISAIAGAGRLWVKRQGKTPVMVKVSAVAPNARDAGVYVQRHVYSEVASGTASIWLRCASGECVVEILNSASGIETVQLDLEPDTTDLTSAQLPKPKECAQGDSIQVIDHGVEVVADGRGLKVKLPKPYIEYPDRVSNACRQLLLGSQQKTSAVMIGHSIVHGYGTAADDAGKKITSLPARIAARLNAYTGTVLDTGAVFCEAQQQVHWTLGASVYGPGDVCGNNGHFIFLSNSAANSTITLPGPSVVVYMLANATGIGLRYTVDGGAVQTAALSTSNPTGNGAWHYYNVTITGLGAGNHAIQLIGPTTGQLAVIGAEGRTSNTGVIVHRCAVPGLILPDLLASGTDATDTTGSFRTRTATEKKQQVYSVTKQLGVSLVLLMTDVNDLMRGWTSFQWTINDVKRHTNNVLKSLNDLGLPALVVIGPWLRNGYAAAGCPFNQEDLCTAYREVVYSNPNASLIDIRTPLYDRQGFSNQMMDYFVHPTALGSNHIGNSIADAMS